MIVWPPLEQGSPSLVSGSTILVQNTPVDTWQAKSKVPTLDHARFPQRI